MAPKLLLLGLTLTVAGMAQHRAIGAPVGPIGHGFGNVLFPGTGIPRNHITNLGATIRGVYPAHPGPIGGHRATPVVYPIAYPVYVNPYPYYQQPTAPVVVQPAPAPTVIINHHYSPERVDPVMRDYTREPLPEPGSMQSYQAPIPSNPDPPKRASEDKPTIYLIALKDGTVYSAYAYWMESDTLHYVTTRHAHNQASLNLVDSTVSNQLNRERGVEFKLPE
jgi:hypothetical protein